MRPLAGVVLCALALCLPWGCNGADDPAADGESGAGIERSWDDAPPLELRTRWWPNNPADRLPASKLVDGKLDVNLQRNWRYIILHHSGTRSGSEASFDRYHRRQKGWKGIGYDFVIGNGNGSPDGLIEVTFRWEKQVTGAHAGVARYNQHGIGICLVGDFSSGQPTDRQMKSLVALLFYLKSRCDIPTTSILTHGQLKQTDCPGENFPYDRLLSLLGP